MKKQTKTKNKMTDYEQQMTELILKWLHRFKVKPSKSIIELTNTVEQMEDHPMTFLYIVGDHTIRRDDILGVLSDPPKEMAIAILKGLSSGYKARLAKEKMIHELTSALEKTHEGTPMVSDIDIEGGKITVRLRLDRKDEMWTACFEGNSIKDIISQLDNEDEWECELGPTDSELETYFKPDTHETN